MNRNFGLSTGVVALFALMFHISPMGSDQGATGGKLDTNPKKVAAGKGDDMDSSQRNSPNDPPEGPWLATRAAVAPAADPNPAIDRPTCLSDIPSDACRNQVAAWFGTDGVAEIQAVLTTVPDPLHTRLALLTDGALDAIEASASAAGWVFATQWLPWLDPFDPDVKDIRKRRAQRKLAREQEIEPGVLVFRRQMDRASLPPRFNAKLLLVFVVGETPTGGINQFQFRNAREYMRYLGIHTEATLVLGPTFSGSFYSLAKLAAEDTRGNYVIRSGNASSVHDSQALKATPNVEFRGVNLDSEDFVNYFWSTLGALEIPEDKAAILAEDETQFGFSVLHKTTEKPTHAILTLKFPRDISQLRNAYRENRPSASDQRLPPELEFSLKDNEFGEDNIPTFSRSQSPLSQDARLEQAVDTIRRAQIRAVEIIATSPLDVLFLARVLQTKSPDTRIILPYANLLFVEAARNEALRNMLALSSYPLFEERRHWLDPNVALLPHSDSVSEGVFNAMLLLLAKIQALDDHDLRDTLEDYNWKQQRHPPVWLLSVDRDGFLPLRAFLHPPCSEDTDQWWDKHQSRTGESSLPPTRLWNFVEGLAALIGFVAMIFSGLLWFGDGRSGPFWMTVAQWDGRFLPAVINSKDRSRLFYLFNFFLLLAAMQAVLCVPWFAFPNQPGLAYLGLAEAACIAAFALCFLLRFLFKQRNARAEVFRWATVISVAAYAIGLYIWVAACQNQSDSAGLFFSLRAVELRVGSSPALPVLAALFALTLFCYVHVSRIYLAACQEPSLAIDLKTALRRRLTKYSQSLRDHFGSRFGLIEWTEWLWVAGGLLFASCVAFSLRPYGNLAGPDGRPFNPLLITLQSIVAGMLLHSCVHMFRLWVNLKSFLISLGTLPLATKFIARSRMRNKRPIWVQNLNLQSLSTLVRGPTILHDISLKNGPDLKAMYEDYRLVVIGLIDASANPTLNRVDLLKQNAELDSKTIDITTKLFDEILVPHWKTSPLVEKLEPAELKSLEPEREPSGQVTISGDPGNIVDLAGAFVALQFTPFLLYSLRQIQNLVWFLSLGFVALAISMNADSPQSPQLVSRFLLLVFLLIATVLWRCLAGIERDPIISRIEGTKAGELNADFYFKLIGYGALPAIGLLASEFPSIANFLFSWIEPTLAAMR